MSVLHDKELDRIARAGAVEPYDPKMLQPASIDFNLGTTFRVPEPHLFSKIDLAAVPLDFTREVEIEPDGHYYLPPHGCVLGRTAEIIRVPKNMVARMEGKSSLGRVFLAVHITAGFFDPGFEGYGTCEFVNLMPIPILLRPGLPVCQFSFHMLTGESEGYKGRYRDGNKAAGSRYGHPVDHFGDGFE